MDAPSPPATRAVPRGPALDAPASPARPASRSASAEAVAVPPWPDAACAPDSMAGGCHIGDVFRLLSQAHMLDLLHVLIAEPRPLRFVELQDRLRLSPNTLSARLKALADAGLVSRTAFQQIPPRVDYQATDKARDLKSVFAALWQWSRRHDLKPVGVPVAA